MNIALAPWKDLRYTHLTSSILLALPFAVGFGVQAFQPGRRGDEVLISVTMALLQLLLFPLARELYFMLTEPIRRGLEGFILWGPLVLALVVGKIIMYLVLSVLGIPLGLLGFGILALRARFA